MLLDQLLPARYQAMLTDEFTLRDNPVETRERRRDARRRDSPLMTLLTVALLWLVFILTVWLLSWLSRENHLRRGIPSWAGGSYGALMLILFSGVHVGFVYQAFWRHTNAFFLQEYRQNTLATLLGTRTPPFQLILQATLFPFKQAMWIAIIGLPFYIFAWSLGGARIADIIGLYLLYALMALRPPRWNVPVFGGMTAEQIVKAHKAGRPATWAEWALKNVPWLLFGGFSLQGHLNWAFGSGWFWRLASPLGNLIPREVASIAWVGLLSWPVMLARWMLIPLPFYSIALPPVVMVALLVLLSRLIGAWHSSLNLRIADRDQMAVLWDISAYGRMQAVFGTLVAFVALGFLWKPYVASGITGSLVAVRSGSIDLALAGLLWLMICCATILFWFRVAASAAQALAIRMAAKHGESGEYAPPSARVIASWGAFLRYLTAPLMMAGGVYVFGCIFAGHAPFPAAAARLAGPLVIVVLTSGLAIAGLRMITPFYFLLVPIPLLGWVLPDASVGSWIASASPLAGLFSLSAHTQRILGAIPGIHPLAPDWRMCALSTTVAGLCLMWTRMRSGMASRQPVIVPPPASALPAAPVALAVPAQVAAPSYLAPPRQHGQVADHSYVAPSEGQSAPAQAAPPLETPVYPKKQAPKKRDTEGSRRLVEWAQQRWDSAVMTKEMRVLFRGHLGKDELLALPIMLLLVLGVLFYYQNEAAQIFRIAAVCFFGNSVSGYGSIIGGLIAIPACLMAAFIPAAAAGVCSRAFCRERDRSTLGFLLATPLTTDEILWGKLLGLLAPSFVMLAMLTAWNALMSLFLVPNVGPITALAGYIAATIIPFALTLVGGLFGLVSSTLFRKETDSSSSAVSLTVGLTALLFFIAYTLYGLLMPWIGEYPPVVTVYVWLACLLVMMTMLWPLGWALARWRVVRARSGDISMEGAGMKR